MLIGETAPRILVISLPGMGDTVNTTPLFQLIKQAYPAAHLSVLVMYESTKQLLQRDPHIDEVLFWPFLQKNAFASLRFMGKIRKRKFAVSLLSYPSNRTIYNLISLLSGAPLRLAHRYNHLFYSSLGFVNTHLVAEDDHLHNVEENVHLFSLLMGEQTAVWDKPVLHLTEEDHAWAAGWLAEYGIEKKEDTLLIGFSPATATLKNHIKRRWDPDKFIALGKRLVEKYQCKLLLFGGVSEEALKEYIATGIGSAAISVPAATMPQTGALMKQCQLLVTNDSGLMHTAAALSVPTAALFGPTSIPGLYPYRMKHQVISQFLDCAPCFVNSRRPLHCDRYGDYRCIADLSVDLAFQAVEKLLPDRDSN